MLLHQIKADMVAAMKARDTIKVNTLRGAMTAFTNELVAKGKKPTEEIADADAIVVLKRLAKQRKDSVEQFTKGGRMELADKESAELKIIETYLPKTASREDIEKVARAKLAEGITDAGKLTGAIMKEFAGSADGADVKAVVQAILS